MVTLYTDGSCLGNPGPGGWAVAVGKKIVASGGENETTNNRMEITAAIKALEWIKKNTPAKATIFSDSSLVVRTINENWKKKSNEDLWMKLEKLLIETHAIPKQWNWVKGHAGHEGNELVDDAAREQALKHSKSKTPKKIETPQKQHGEFFCKTCGKEVEPTLEKLNPSGLIKASCPECRKYIKFAKHPIQER